MLPLPEKGLDSGLVQVPQDENADGQSKDGTDPSGDQGTEVKCNIDDDNDDPNGPYPAPALETPMPIRRSMIPMMKRLIPRDAPRNPSPMNPSTASPKNLAMIQKSPPRIQRIARRVIPNVVLP
ncbi:MAG TPA: hypothetical protein PLU94_02985 [Methanoregulaceae archaeon]|nr:hypothetical protein [Methanoregulaceae archaeon]